MERILSWCAAARAAVAGLLDAVTRDGYAKNYGDRVDESEGR